jgi:hypothetical protein
MDEDRTIFEAASAPAARVFPHREGQGTEPSDTYKVPANTRWVFIEAHGGSGGYSTGGESGGPGGGSIIRGLVPVVPGETLSIYSGGGAFHGWQGRPGYRPGGDGGKVKGDPSNGGGGGGSTAVVNSTGQVLIHAAGGGGSGGRGGAGGSWQDGGDGGSAGLSPGDGKKGGSTGPWSHGGDGGKGGDTRLTDRGGNGFGADGAGAGGAGGGGGGGLYCGDGGHQGSGIPSGGGGGGGSGTSDIIPTAIGVWESHRSPQVGYVKVSQPAVVLSTVASSAFKDVVLRMDGTGVGERNPIGGVVNCQHTAAGHYEHFYVRPQPDGTVTLESEQFLDVFLRMDGTGLSPEKPTGAGVVNCRYGTDALTYFRIVAHPERLLAIESVAFPGAYLGMDGTGVDKFLPSGGGKAYCRFGAFGWEAFRMLAIA